jgi:hypothetical protein
MQGGHHGNRVGVCHRVDPSCKRVPQLFEVVQGHRLGLARRSLDSQAGEDNCEVQPQDHLSKAVGFRLEIPRRAPGQFQGGLSITCACNHCREMDLDNGPGARIGDFGENPPGFVGSARLEVGICDVYPLVVPAPLGIKRWQERLSVTQTTFPDELIDCS